MLAHPHPLKVLALALAVYCVRDLEGVVDALKRVTDKLRGENDRLRRMAGEGGGRAEAERSAREAKKKAASFVLRALLVGPKLGF